MKGEVVPSPPRVSPTRGLEKNIKTGACYVGCSNIIHTVTYTSFAGCYPSYLSVLDLMLRPQVEFTDVHFFLKLWQAKGTKISEFYVQALYVLISYLRWQGEKDVLSVMTTEPSAMSQGANKTFPWKFSTLPKRKDSWMARKYVKQFSLPPLPRVSVLRDCEPLNNLIVIQLFKKN